VDLVLGGSGFQEFNDRSTCPMLYEQSHHRPFDRDSISQMYVMSFLYVVGEVEHIAELPLAPADDHRQHDVFKLAPGHF